MVCPIGQKGTIIKIMSNNNSDAKRYFVTLVETKQQLIERNHEGKSMAFWLTSNVFYNTVTILHPMDYLAWLKEQPSLTQRNYRISFWEEITVQQYNDWVDVDGFSPT